MIVTMQDYAITDRAPVLIGYEGENLSRNFTVETADDLSGIASIELLIGDVNCGAMTVNNTDDTEITISLDAFMIGRAGYKKAQLIMLDDTGAVVMKSNQFDVLVGASNNPRYFAAGEKVKTLTVNIDGRTRQIILPAGFAVSVNGDVAVDHIAFKAPASYGDFDFSTAACRVDWTGVDGTSHTNICTEKDADGNWIWALPTALTRGGEGEISFSVSYVVTDNAGAVTADWNTGLVKFYHLESAKSDDAEEDVEEETTYDRLASAIAAVQAAQASVDDVNAILAGITSATPTVVETVADLNGLDTSKVKLAIVAADGYLYYYNGTAWVSGFAYGGLQEVIAARTDSDGVTHADLKTRLNTAEAQIKEDLSYNSEVLSTEDGFSTYPITQKARLASDGSVVSSTPFVTTDFIPLKSGTYKVIRKNFNGGFTIYRCTYDSQKKLIEYTTFTQDAAEREYVVPGTNVAFIRYSVSEVVYNGGISFKLVENLKDDVNIIRGNVYGNLCGDNPDEFYPVVLSEGDYIALSTSTGDAPPNPIELIFFDANYYRIGAYTLNAKRRSIKIDQTYAATKYIKWSKKPDVPMQVELGGSYTEYKEYRPNIFTCAQLLDESKNVYTYAPLPIVAVMTYNVGEWYNGTRTEMPESEYTLYENIQRTILRKNYASIFCAQEYYHTMYTKSLDAKNMFLYPLYKHVSTMDDTALSRGKAIATNLWVESVESVDFVNQSGIASKYQKAYLFINGHKVCVCNVHLSNIDTQQALLEAREIATAMADEEYFIVMGDFNVSFASATGAEIISAFEAIGATPCNYGSFGQFDTYRGSTSIGTTDSPIDNIFVSSSITIKSVYMDTTKIDANLPVQDHVPLVAYLEIF